MPLSPTIPAPARRRVNTAKKGRAAEHEMRKKLEAKGCLVLRAAGSKGPCDLVALVPELPDGLWLVGCKVRIDARVLLIEVKSGKSFVFGPERRSKRELGARYGGVALVAHRSMGMDAADRWTIEVA